MSRSALLGSFLVLAALVALWLVVGGGRRTADPEAEATPEWSPDPALGEDEVELVGGAGLRADGGRLRAAPEPPGEPEASLDAAAASRQSLPQEASVRLHVRDGRSGRELAPVFVLDLERLSDPLVARPGLMAERAERMGASPVHLEVPLDERTVFARSPGFGWGRIEIGPYQRERFLDLEPGGDLHVRVVGGPRDPGTIVRVFADERRRLLAELELHLADELVFEALPVGSVEVAAMLGGAASSRTVAWADAEIDAGAVASATLVLEPVEPARWVPLSGSLLLPPEWELDDFRLQFQLEGPALERWPGRPLVDRVEMTLADREAGLYLWDAREVQPGVYGVELVELGFGARVVVGGVGADDVRIEVGPPSDVRVRCVDALTRQPTGFVALERGSSREDAPTAFLPLTDWNAGFSGYAFRAPRGRLRLTAPELSRSQDYAVRPGQNEFEFELAVTAPTGVRLSLADEEGPVPWDLRKLPTLEPLSGDRRPAAWSLDRGWLVLRVDGPGSHRLRLPDLDGYERVPERDVELEAGRLLEIGIELVRRR